MITGDETTFEKIRKEFRTQRGVNKLRRDQERERDIERRHKRQMKREAIKCFCGGWDVFPTN